MTRLSDYEPVVGSAVLEELEILAEKVQGRAIQHVNSTFTGGGVAEILARLVPLLRELGIRTSWSVISGDARFFDVTKKIHNALHGRADPIDDDDDAVFRERSEVHLAEVAIEGDVVVIHDPQPCGLVRKRSGSDGSWVWRCHIDLSHPREDAWALLRPWVEKYDAAIFSAPQFSRGLSIRELLVAPSIDPLSDKNRDLEQEEVDAVFEKYAIPTDLPVITQISRFDRLKDPVGLIRAFELVRRSIDCRLVLAGGTASDDPESEAVLAEVQERAKENPFVHVLLLPPKAEIDVNALQRGSTILVQKSLAEGFALTVAEGLWKERPVLATAVGGIPLQIKDGITGLLAYGIEGAAHNLRQLLANPAYAAQLARNGKEHVRQNFLITRHVRDYLLLALALSQPGPLIHLDGAGLVR